jgi:uncharacterized protein
MNKRAIVHVEIPAKDRETTAKFYSDLFGWEFQHYSEPSPYTMFETGNIGGGYPDVSENTKPGDVLVYIASSDIDADLKKIESKGGQVLMPRMDVGGMGQMAVFADPAGNRLALWKEASRPPA